MSSNEVTGWWSVVVVHIRFYQIYSIILDSCPKTANWKLTIFPHKLFKKKKRTPNRLYSDSNTLEESYYLVFAKIDIDNLKLKYEFFHKMVELIVNWYKNWPIFLIFTRIVCVCRWRSDRVSMVQWIEFLILTHSKYLCQFFLSYDDGGWIDDNWWW